jgi:NRAMP (natural resistance-associated macrophage protein)-like metal ion transporter
MMAVSKTRSAQKETKQPSRLERIKAYVRALGPGVITGASDDDPSGIGTYSQTGAAFGYTQLWTPLFTIPLMIGMQEICARIALQTGSGLAVNIRRHFPKPVLYFCVSLLFIANTINLGADLGAMADAGTLLLGIPFLIWLVAITVLSAALLIFMEYRRYARVLQFLTLSLFAYLLVPFVSPMDWGQAVRHTVIPTVQLDKDYMVNLVALLGTTISPYLFFWQANQEVEEEINAGKTTERKRQGVSKLQLKWMRTDVTSGILLSNVVFWFIVATTASTLFQHGVRNIDSATQAAEALRPIAGNFAYTLFAVGILGTGLLAVPILAGSAAYAVAEAFKMREGLYLKARQAPGFYGVIILSTVVGFAMNLVGINPIQALYYSAVLNGLVAPPLLVIIMLLGNNPHVMKDEVNGRISNTLGWITTVLMTLAAGALLFSMSTGQ